MPGICFCIQDIVVPSEFTLLGYGCYTSVFKMGDTYECWDSKLVCASTFTEVCLKPYKINEKFQGSWNWLDLMLPTFQFPLERGFEENSSVAFWKVSLIWTSHFHPRLKLHVWNTNGSAWRQTGPHKLVISRYSFSVEGLAPWFSVCLFVLVNVKECIKFSTRDQICQMSNSFQFQTLCRKHFHWLF